MELDSVLIFFCFRLEKLLKCHELVKVLEKPISLKCNSVPVSINKIAVYLTQVVFNLLCIITNALIM